jgi:hypothetical protein
MANFPNQESKQMDLSRRAFLKSTAGTALAATTLTTTALATPLSSDSRANQGSPESTVRRLYDSLSDSQRKIICFDWNHHDPKRGLLRTFIANNWNITPAEIRSDFYTPEQQAVIREIFEGIIQPDWHGRIDKQLQDDAGGFGHRQSVAIFGDPRGEKYEFVMTGRHMTLRCDGNSTPHMAFGGPIFYGHAAEGFHETATHPGNVFWPQAVAANRVFAMLDGKQRKQALVEQSPNEQSVEFKGQADLRPGIPVSELSADQRSEMQKVLAKLVEPYRKIDQSEVQSCLQSQGGLDQCRLAFYNDRDIGQDGVWDNWRLEGPAFVWYFRGSPHVHVWVHVADNPDVPLNA